MRSCFSRRPPLSERKLVLADMIEQSLIATEQAVTTKAVSTAAGVVSRFKSALNSQVAGSRLKNLERECNWIGIPIHLEAETPEVVLEKLFQHMMPRVALLRWNPSLAVSASGAVLPLSVEAVAPAARTAPRPKLTSSMLHIIALAAVVFPRDVREYALGDLEERLVNLKKAGATRRELWVALWLSLSLSACARILSAILDFFR